MAFTSEGFAKVQFTGTFMGQQTLNTFYYGFPEGAVMNTNALCEAAADEIVTELAANPATAPSYEAWRLPFRSDYVLTGVDVWVKGAFGTGLAVRPVALSIQGARVLAGDSLPPQVTASAYAPSQAYGQRGAKLGFSGGLEPDIEAAGWIATAGNFKDLIQTFCNTMYQGGFWNVGVGGLQLVPAVVPRIRVGAMAPYTYRLPIEATDVPQTVAIAPWSVGSGSGSANSRKNPIR